MKTVWKFPLEPLAPRVVMPEGARIVHIAAQAGEVCLWAEVNPEAPREKRTFHCVMTGGRADGRGEYVGTAHLVDSGLVVHVYEEALR